MIISVTELRTLLKIQGIVTDLTDEELTELINFKTKEINGYIGYDIENTTHRQHEFKFRGDTVLLLHYPVSSVSAVTLDNTIIPAEEYSISHEDGILSFINQVYGELNIIYESNLPYSIVSRLIVPLLVDMVVYVLKNIEDHAGVASMTEGGISITYDREKNSTLINRIQKRLQELQNYFSARLRMI